MRWWSELKFMIRKLNRKRVAEELDEEIRAHLELEADEKIEEGQAPEEARYAARRNFGNILIARENSRAVWGFGLLDILWNDLRYSAKGLQKTPGFTLAAALTFGLGIGVSTAIYSVVNAIYFKPLPGVRNPEELCRIELAGRPDREFQQVPYSDYLEMRQKPQTLSGLAAYRSIEWRVGFKGRQHQQMRGEMVSGNYFQVLGVRAAMGRVLTPEDEKDGARANNAIVLGDATWRDLFQADPEIIGKEITGPVNRNYIVVGIAPPGFHGSQLPTDSRYWIMIDKAEQLKFEMKERTVIAYNGFSLIGRMKPGSDSRQVRAEMGLFFAHFKELRPEVYLDRFAGVESARGYIASKAKEAYKALIVVWVIVGVLMFITCANVAGLQLARALNRRKEIAVRLALGASRWRIICLLLTESALPALLGGALAAALSFKTTSLVSRALDMIFLAIPRSDFKYLVLDFSPDWRVFVVTLLISISVGIICGLVPALKTSRADLTEVTKSESSLQTISIRRFSWQNLLVVMQVSGSVLLLIIAGLTLLIFRQSMQVKPGFQKHNLFITEFGNRSVLDTGNRKIPQLIHDLQSRAATLPNVKAIAAGEGPPKNGGSEVITVAGTEQKPFGDMWVRRFFVNTPKYFETLGIPFVAGRDFTEQDLSGARRTVIIDERIARQAFPGQNPIGRWLRLDPKRDPDNIHPLEIIGVVRDLNYETLAKGPRPNFYLPLNRYSSGTIFFVRTHNDPAATLPAMAKLIRSMEPEMEFSQRTMEDALYLNVAPMRIVSAFFAFFGVMGLLLASVGLMGVMGYSVARRTREIGIRMALGADRNQVLRMVIGEGLALTSVGILIGVSAAAGAIRTLTTIRSLDLLSYGGAILTLLLAALLACYFPARKASKVDPMIALRND